MFKKLKDKLAEEVKSSPQRIQQFAQAAQAAVTSASSSISDITNNDLFSIGDNDSQQSRVTKINPNDQKSSFQDVTLVSPTTQTDNDSMDFLSSSDLNESQRQRRLSNSSLASDVSFRLPSYESPSMYHLQSDMEISASEADERGFSGGNVSLDRVTKEQIYAAYRRTQERYTKYRTQYADLARHYKLLERENAKAKSVLVETQDKALRRISELREQCALEQSAKAHLEKALRIEIEEKNIKIDTLNTTIKLLKEQDRAQTDKNDADISKSTDNAQLISFDTENNQTSEEILIPSEVTVLNKKIEKLETLVNKYKESLKTTKDKNSQLTTETQILSNEIENKNKDIIQLKESIKQIQEYKEQIHQLNDLNEELQNKVNAFDFNKSKEITTLELDLQKSQEEIEQLKAKIGVFTKREEEYAISLAENKLSIHKELESKETEIKSLKDSLSESKQEIQSLNIVITDYKNNILSLEEEKSKLRNDLNELNLAKAKMNDLESQLQILTQKCQTLESFKIKADEEYKCLQLQLKQETAEKLAMIDRNAYLEERNTQLTEDNAKKNMQLNNLGNEMLLLKKAIENENAEESSENFQLTEELNMWKNKYNDLQSQIQEEREELIKLQTDIEKLLANHETIRTQYIQLQDQVEELEHKNKVLHEKDIKNTENIKIATENLLQLVNDFKKSISLLSKDTKSFIELNNNEVSTLKHGLDKIILTKLNEINILENQCEQYKKRLSIAEMEHTKVKEELQVITDELTSVKQDNIFLKSEIGTKNTKDMDSKVKLIHDKYEDALDKLKNIEIENQELQISLQKMQSKYQEKLQSVEQNINYTTTLEQEKATLEEKLHQVEHNYATQTEEILTLKESQEDKIRQLKSLITEKEALSMKLENIGKIQQEMELNIKQITQENILLKNKFADCSNALTEESEALKQKVKEVEEKEKVIQGLQEDINNLTEENTFINNNVQQMTQALNKEKEFLKKSFEDAKSKEIIIQKLQTEIDRLQQEQQSELVSNTQKNDILGKQLKDIEQLQEKVKDLTQENIKLKSQSEGITKNIEQMEFELTAVRQSHADIEVEKDHLSAVIEQLGSKEREKVLFEKNTQTFDDCETLEVQVVSNLSHSQTINPEEIDLLKEENKRLQSDVVGLQNYLAKISKENSILNDKLRELIASSENSEKSEYLNESLSDLKNEVQTGKAKLNDLIRENMLLVEENLELKDQINSHNYAKPLNSTINDTPNDSENPYMKEKYEELLDHKSKFEQRISELEQMNKSVSGNMLQMQEKNEKLRLNNEKLERRLDEALVSLRHLHSLQENTELEYLRNILYEYLTGTGAHSVTLAKVLAAVVKFDDSQTKQVLQKEKERQGLLRQLGLL